MPSFNTTRRVRHSPQAMFALVADVERYPEFVPLCVSMRLLSRRALPDGHEEILARMGVGYKALRENFTSRVTLDAEKCAIHVSYVDGPFRFMENDWRFEPVKDDAGCVVEHACTVHFSLSYEFKSRALAALMGVMFDTAFRKFASAFEARADALDNHAGAG